MTGDNNKEARAGPFFNYVTREYEQRAFPSSFDEARAYVPQTRAAQNLFRELEEKGFPLHTAMVRTLFANLIAELKKLKGDG